MAEYGSVIFTRHVVAFGLAEFVYLHSVLIGIYNVLLTSSRCLPLKFIKSIISKNHKELIRQDSRLS